MLQLRFGLSTPLVVDGVTYVSRCLLGISHPQSLILKPILFKINQDWTHYTSKLERVGGKWVDNNSQSILTRTKAVLRILCRKSWPNWRREVWNWAKSKVRWYPYSWGQTIKIRTLSGDSLIRSQRVWERTTLCKLLNPESIVFLYRFQHHTTIYNLLLEGPPLFFFGTKHHKWL